jgi:hypothetical protein
LKVRETLKNPNFSPFTKEIVRVGEAIEKLGYDLTNENYSQGEQAFNFSRERMRVTVLISEDD